MKKFKLIKNYPDSFLEVGDIITFFDGQKEVELLKNKYSYVYSLKDCQNYTEFWEQVEVLNYEVVTLIHKTTKEILTFDSDTSSYPKGFLKSIYKTLDYWVECFTLPENPWNIYSIKRLSDGEIFTIGNKICNTFSNLEKQQSYVTILGFFYNVEKILCINIETGYIDTSMETSKGFSNIKKYVKEMFKTEDGVPVYKQNHPTLYWVKNDFTEGIDLENSLFLPDTINYKYFVSRKQRKLYINSIQETILLNKNCLSINDIKSISAVTDNSFGLIGILEDKLKELVKNKLYGTK